MKEHVYPVPNNGQLRRPIWNGVYLKDVVTLKLDQAKCIGCGMCTIVCPHNVFNLDSKKASVMNKDACMECGACARNCPVGAISVKAGVGCAYGIIMGKLRGTAPACDCASGKGKSCC